MRRPKYKIECDGVVPTKVRFDELDDLCQLLSDSNLTGEMMRDRLTIPQIMARACGRISGLSRQLERERSAHLGTKELLQRKAKVVEAQKRTLKKLTGKNCEVCGGSGFDPYTNDNPCQWCGGDGKQS